jgi:putative endonuclease
MTSDATARLSQHNLGVYETAYTFTRRPVTLVYSTEFTDVHEAISWERRVKWWSRAKKLALIEGNWDALKKHSKKVFKR